MKLSIIIPVYKVEKYIRNCLNSIYKQNFFENLEVIVINDGSPDNSVSIVNEFARKYGNLILINQSNQGLSVARNIGLSRATGEYVWFVDSDDQLMPEVFPELFGTLDYYSCDVVGFDVLSCHEGTGEEKCIPCVIDDNGKLYNSIVSNRDIVHRVQTALVQMFIFKREFLIKHGIQFHVGIIHEDVEFMGKVYFFAKKITFLHQQIYRYLLRSTGSIMATLNTRSLICRDMIICHLGDFRKEYAQTVFEKAFLDDFTLKILMLMFDFKNQDSEAESQTFFIAHKNLYRKVALRGAVANVFFCSPKKVLRALSIAVNPFWYYQYRRLL